MTVIKNVKVLIIDDEPDIVELMEEEFRYFGFETISANCGNEAIELLRKEKVDIVVSDFKMPNGNGMSVLNHVKKMQNPPLFYFVSGQADLSEKESIEAGAKHFFSKPFDLDTLIKMVETDARSLILK